MTAAELITRVAIRNGWTLGSIWQGRYHVVVSYIRSRNGPYERVEIRYPQSLGVHSARYIVDFSTTEYVGPTSTGRRAAAIRWFKS